MCKFFLGVGGFIFMNIHIHQNYLSHIILGKRDPVKHALENHMGK